MDGMMRANVYSGPGKCEIKQIPIPECKENQVLIKVMSCGICKGADVALARGGFIARFPLVNGHEFSGVVVKVGSSVTGLKEGDRVTVDNTVLCGNCYYCRRNQPLYCENFYSLGCNGPGGFAEFVVQNADKVFKISDNLSFNEACFAEPTACAVHTMDRLQIRYGDEVLVFGTGPTGIVLIQLLLHSSAGRVVVCGRSKDKLELLQSLGCTETILMDSNDPSIHEDKLKKIAPRGFDIIVDTTASVEVMERSIQFAKMGGKFMMFAMPHEAEKWTINPCYWYLHELTLLTSWAQTHCFDRALQYLESGMVKVKNLVTHEFDLADYNKGIAIAEKGGPGTLKVILHPNYE